MFNGPAQMAAAKLNGLPATVMAKTGAIQGVDYYMIRFDDGSAVTTSRRELVLI
jgi:hypothetical protein